MFPGYNASALNLMGHIVTVLGKVCCHTVSNIVTVFKTLTCIMDLYDTI